ncbi:flavin reductase family protein [Arthrobacter sp. Br18]|uniref:flavin reductase family protein n=1 Tax=Arthrobacter sp. Br18 TaxID=1312954 RepID=UPI00047B6795|nr:flavin reductase family protein [Arthrobacter sp. Br18]
MVLDVNVEPNVLRQAFGRFPSGIAALCSRVDGVPEGIVASSFTVGVSLDPPLVMFAIQNESRTWPVLRKQPRIGVSVLASGQKDACLQIASKSADRFAALDIDCTSAGAVFLSDAALWLDCSVEAEYPAGDHQVVLLRVHGLQFENMDPAPLVFHASGFHRLPEPSLV